MFSGEHRGGVIAGNARSSSERGRISAYSGVSDHGDSMDNPSSREDISEMYVFRICMKSLRGIFFFFFNHFVDFFLFFNRSKKYTHLVRVFFRSNSYFLFYPMFYHSNFFYLDDYFV